MSLPLYIITTQSSARKKYYEQYVLFDIDIFSFLLTFCAINYFHSDQKQVTFQSQLPEPVRIVSEDTGKVKPPCRCKTYTYPYSNFNSWQ